MPDSPELVVRVETEPGSTSCYTGRIYSSRDLTHSDLGAPNVTGPFVTRAPDDLECRHVPSVHWYYYRQ